MYKFDGITYEKESEAPDLGSIRCVNNDGMIREYEGLSADISKLPKYDVLKTGSSFLAIDTGKVYKYEETTETWYEL